MFNIGDKAYFEETWSENIIGGKVLEIKQTESKNGAAPQDYLVIQIEGSKYDKRNALVEKCHPSREAAKAAQDAENNAIKDKYRSEINSVQELVQFMYNHTIATGAGEYTNWNGREVAREKAKELLGVDLED